MPTRAMHMQFGRLFPSPIVQGGNGVPCLSTDHLIGQQTIFLAQGGNGDEQDEVGEWRGRRSDILDIREGGDTIRFSRKERDGHPCFSLFGSHQRFKVVERDDFR